MSNIDVVQQFLSSLEQGNMHAAAQMLSDHFLFKGPSLLVLTKAQYLEAHGALVQAIPDWQYNPTGWREEGDTVSVKMHITGTHTHTLRYPFPSVFKEEPPTHRHLSLPEETTRVEVRDGKITSMEADIVPGGGIMGVLEQLGLKAPVPAGV